MATSGLLKISPSNAILSNHVLLSRPRTLMCLNNPPGSGKAVATRAASCSWASVPKTDKRVDLGLLLPYAISNWPWGSHIQMFVEKAIIDCRFFTLLAVAGSLLASLLCFVEGCLLVVVSYLQYFTEQGDVVFQLIEAIDMFLMGTAMVVFAMALHVMFVGQNNFKSPFSNNKKLPPWIGMESAMQAKSKMGHALMMILQIQVLDKFKSITVSNGSDLACFAGAIFLSSASLFLLSRISFAGTSLGGVKRGIGMVMWGGIGKKKHRQPIGA